MADAMVLGAIGRPCRFESCYPQGEYLGRLGVESFKVFSFLKLAILCLKWNLKKAICNAIEMCYNQTNTKEFCMKETKIQWHPGFLAAMNLELSQNRNDLVFEKECNLNAKPLEIDLLIIKKLASVRIVNERGNGR